MNCTKSVADSPPSLVLLSMFMLSPHLAWTSTMAAEGISPTLPLAIQTYTYSKAVHMTGLKYSSDHRLKSQERYIKAFSRDPLPLNRTCPYTSSHFFLLPAPLHLKHPDQGSACSFPHAMLSPLILLEHPPPGMDLLRSSSSSRTPSPPPGSLPWSCPPGWVSGPISDCMCMALALSHNIPLQCISLLPPTP